MPGGKSEFHFTTPSTSKADSNQGNTPKVDTSCSKALANNVFLYHKILLKRNVACENFHPGADPRGKCWFEHGKCWFKQTSHETCEPREVRVHCAVEHGVEARCGRSLVFSVQCFGFRVHGSGL